MSPLRPAGWAVINIWHLPRSALVFGSRRHHWRAALVGLRLSGDAPTPLPIRSWPGSRPAWLKAELRGEIWESISGAVAAGWPAWSYCLDVAGAFGWQPEGTRPAAWVNSDGSPCENSRYADWNGSYMSNEYQTVTDSDPHALAAALARAIGPLAVDARLSSEQLMVARMRAAAAVLEQVGRDTRPKHGGHRHTTSASLDPGV